MPFEVFHQAPGKDTSTSQSKQKYPPTGKKIKSKGNSLIDSGKLANPLVPVVEPPLRHLDQVIEGKPYLGLPLTLSNVQRAWVHLLLESCGFCMCFLFFATPPPVGAKHMGVQ